MLNRSAKFVLLCAGVILSAAFVSCQSRSVTEMDIRVFEKTNPVKIEKKSAIVSDYAGGYEWKEEYDLYLYRESADFSDYYKDAHFVRKDVEYKKEYESLLLSKVYKNYLYFHLIDAEKVNRVFRYDMTNGTEEEIFTYDEPNQMSIAALNDEYIIWQEDENANWMKVSLNCYDIRKGENTRFFTYSRDENGYNSWNFDNIVLDGDHVYFDDIEGKENGKAVMNLYDYDIAKNTLDSIDRKRATNPMTYKGLSWLSYDDENDEYILKNRNNPNVVRLGSKYFNLISSKNIAVGQSNRDIDKDGIMYFDGKDSYPILQSTNSIDSVGCTDEYIVWDGWSHDAPLFYDRKNDTIVRVDCLEQGLRYAGYVSEDYLVFGAHEYVPDPDGPGDSAVTTKTLIYYFVKTSDLKR